MRNSVAISAACAALLATVTAIPLGAQSDAASTAARDILDTACAACHGSDLAGARAPSLLAASLFTRLGGKGVRDRIARGVAGTEMPAFEDVYTGEQIDAIVSYLQSRATGDTSGSTASTLPATPTLPVPDPDGQRFHTDHQDIRLTTVAAGIDTPSALDFLPDGRMLVTERGGRLWIVDLGGTRLTEVRGTPTVHVGQDAGLFDVAVSPQYERDRWIYLAYSDSNPADPEPPPPPAGTPSYLIKRKPSMTVIVRGKLDADNNWVGQEDVYRAPWSLYSPGGMHYGSRLLFDRDGYLYFTIGDRGDMTSARRKDAPTGKIHRVYPDGSIPRDNPFVRDAGAVRSIWSVGHRNPQGLAFDPRTGLLWESEHGPIGGDEINVIRKGLDYGWGTASKGMQPGIELVEADGLVDPVAWYFPTIAPSGITFYNADRYPYWKGSLFVAALRGQQLRRIEVQGDAVTGQEIVFQQVGRVRDIETGPDGLLYVLIQEPTGPGTGLDLSDPAPGAVVRLDPITWRQEPFRRPQ